MTFKSNLVQLQQPAGIIQDGSTGYNIEIELTPERPSTIDWKPSDHTWTNNASKKELIDALNVFLLTRHEQGRTTVLIVDEAQNLSLYVMEQIRILSNIETEKDKLLQIIFLGQLKLNEKLKLPTLKQLNQRISIRYEISPLDKDGTKNYIEDRILVAGAASHVTFTRSAVKEVFNYSKGYPRLINLVCDRALLAAYNQHDETIDRPHIGEAIRSLLGEESKNYFLSHFIKAQLPLIASILFFIAGLSFFILSKKDVGEIFSYPSENLAFPQSAPVPLAPQSVPVIEAPENMETVQKDAATPVRDFIAELDRTSTVPETVLPEPKAPAVEIPQVAKVETTTETSPIADVTKTGNYRVQVYSLRDKAEAEQHKQELEKGGFDVFLKKAVSAGRDWYIVYVGPFSNINSAKVNLKALKFSGREPILLSVSTTSR